MDKNELWRQIQKTEKLFERRKRKRMIFTILLYATVSFILIFLQGQLRAENFIHVIGEYVSCIFLGAMSFYFNLLVWSYLFRKHQDEEKALEFLKKMLEEKERKEKH